MRDFLVMILANEAAEAQLSPAEMKALVEGATAHEKKLRAASAFLDGERLRPSTEGRRVSIREGAVQVENGPFAELALGAYALVKADDLEAATALMGPLPMAPGAVLDVRPVMNGHFNPDKSNEQGRVFGFAVLGSSAHEQGWNEIMDRIDAATRGLLSTRSFSGRRAPECPHHRKAREGAARSSMDPFSRAKR